MESKFSAIPTIKGDAAAGDDGAGLSGGRRGGSKLIIRADGSYCFDIDLTQTREVSWKKLHRDHAAEFAAGASSASKPNLVAGGQFPEASSVGNAAAPSPLMRTAPVVGLVGENAGNEFNRLNSVTGKIERLYVDDDDPYGVVPDEDEYDTDDSFIDDSELNEFLRVDWSPIKHDGVCVQRVEPSTLPKDQTNKKRKDLGSGSDGRAKKPRKPDQSPALSTVIPLPNISGEDGKKSYNASLGILQSIMQKEKLGEVHEASSAADVNEKLSERPEVSGVADARIPHFPKKVGVNSRDRSALLEKAIIDFEKLVESRPLSAEIQSSRAIRKKLPLEIKQELAKVAKYAVFNQASNEIITKELLDRLMTIVGHLVQRRTLKRNFKIMVSKEFAAKEEKDNRVQQIKKEIMARISLMKSKVPRDFDHFQEIGAGESEAFQWKYSKDDILEDKICDLYNLYVDGLEENAAPQVRKLYAELNALWPNGFMDDHGITRAIRRAKDRREACHKDYEELKRMEIEAAQDS